MQRGVDGSPRAWASSVPGLPLLDEGLHTVERTRVHHVARHRAAGVGVGGGDAGLDLAVEERLAERERRTRLRDDGGDERQHLPLALRRIIVPQAVRVALPGVTNDFIALLKDSSLVSVITVVELTKHMTITAVDVRSWAIPGALCAALYMAMSYPLSRLSQYLEARLERK